MACKYVKDFEFGQDFGYTGSAGKTPVKGYYRGGGIKEAVHKHEKAMHPGEPLTKLAKGGQAKVAKVMGEYKEGTLHSGKNGKVVTNPKQAVAIALSEARKGKK